MNHRSLFGPVAGRTVLLPVILVVLAISCGQEANDTDRTLRSNHQTITNPALSSPNLEVGGKQTTDSE